MFCVSASSERYKYKVRPSSVPDDRQVVTNFTLLLSLMLRQPALQLLDLFLLVGNDLVGHGFQLGFMRTAF